MSETGLNKKNYERGVKRAKNLIRLTLPKLELCFCHWLDLDSCIAKKKYIRNRTVSLGKEAKAKVMCHFYLALFFLACSQSSNIDFFKTF